MLSELRHVAILALFAIVAAKKDEAPAPVESPVWPMFAAVAVGGFVGSYLAKGAGIGALAIALGATAGFAALELADAAVFKPMAGLSIVAGGHAAVATILFATPSKPLQATMYSVVGGHIVATLAGMFQLAFVPPQLAFAAKTVTVTLVILGQTSAGAVHPPATAFAFLFVAGNKGYMDAVGPIIGCTLLVLFQQAWVSVMPKAKSA